MEPVRPIARHLINRGRQSLVSGLECGELSMSLIQGTYTKFL